jgi:hypothetical protein
MHMHVLGVRVADARITGQDLFSFCLGGVTPPAASVRTVAKRPPRAATGA